MVEVVLAGLVAEDLQALSVGERHARQPLRPAGELEQRVAAPQIHTMLRRGAGLTLVGTHDRRRHLAYGRRLRRTHVRVGRLDEVRSLGVVYEALDQQHPRPRRDHPQRQRSGRSLILRGRRRRQSRRDRRVELVLVADPRSGPHPLAALHQEQRAVPAARRLRSLVQRRPQRHGRRHSPARECEEGWRLEGGSRRHLALQLAHRKPYEQCRRRCRHRRHEVADRRIAHHVRIRSHHESRGAVGVDTRRCGEAEQVLAG
eukprot:2843329-Prymnesium_polylepis.1